MKRFLIWFLIAAVLVGGIYGYYRWRQAQQSSSLDDLQKTPAVRGGLTATIGATGQVRSKQTASLSWKTSGAVEETFFSVGDEVKEGDKLAELVQTSLPQPVILAQADLETAQRALDDLYTNAETARVQSLQSIASFARAVKEAQYQLDNFTVPDEQARLQPMEAFDEMNARLDQARQNFEPYKFFPSGDSTREDLKEKLDTAQSEFNVAVKRLDYTMRLKWQSQSGQSPQRL